MSKRKKTNTLLSAGRQILAQKHAGAVNLVEVIKKVAPFLFRKKGKSETGDRRPEKVENPQSKIVKAKAKKAQVTKAKKTVRKAVATVSARKNTKEKVTISSSDTQPKGKILVTPKEVEKSAEQVAAETEALSQEEGFMQKVIKSQPAGSAPVQKRSLWGALSDRFGRSKEEAKPQSAPESAEDLKDDTFLQRVQQKSANSVVGTSTDDPNATPPTDLGVRPEMPKSALENFAAAPAMTAPVSKKKGAMGEPIKGKIITAAELKKEAAAVKDAQMRAAAETKKEMAEEQKAAAPVEQKKVEEPPVPHAKPLVRREANGFQKFIAALNHFGMGKERMQFVQNLGTMLNAGLPLIDAIQTLQAETRHKPFKKIVGRILETVENGTPLWRAMDAENLFSLHAIALVRIGEEAGNLAKNMEYLAEQETKDNELVQKVKMAMIYPSIVLTIMFIIVMGLGLFVLPNLIGVLTSLNVKLPLITRLIIMFSNAFTAYGLIIVPSSLGFIAFLLILAKYTKFKVVVQWITFRIPGIGALLKSATIARFGVILGGLLKAGVPVVEAVQSLVQVTPILVYRHLYEKLLDHITIGDSFAKSFASIKGSEKLLPISVQQLVITGEKSGALADIMLKVADIYDKKASDTAQKLPVILEPILLIGIGSLVGTIALAIIVPIYSIVGSVGR